ncbi:MAG: nuclear transport factor 2 family protein [Candidatus Nanopelagicales bacterium]
MADEHSGGFSSLDMPSREHMDKPFFHETVALLRAVRDHDFDTLAGLCDDDFGIVDIAPDGSGVPIRTRPEWEAWFRDSLFPRLEAMGAATDSEILGYQALRRGDLGYGVLDFRQTLTVAGVVATFDCIATLIWKRTSSGWVESRWHCSVISSEVPESLRAVSHEDANIAGDG